MAKKSYIGVDNVARKNKKGYFGVDNLARKLKKGYIGVGGVARPCFTGGELAYYGTGTSLQNSRYDLSGARAGTYAVFLGGHLGDGSVVGSIDVYSSTLVHSTLSIFSAKFSCAAASAGDAYALFVDGNEASGIPYPATYAVSAALVKSQPTNLDTNVCGYRIGTSLGIYALFAGGAYSTSLYGVIYYYSNVLVKGTVGSFVDYTQYGRGASCGCVGSTALFAGGQNQTVTASVTLVSSSLVISTGTSLSQARYYSAAAKAGDYCLVAGGNTSFSSYVSTVDAYSSSLVRTTATSLSSSRADSRGLSVGDYGLFGAGRIKSGNTNVVDIYDANLVRTTMTMSANRKYHAGISVNNFGIFAGGHDGTNALATTDIFTAA